MRGASVLVVGFSCKGVSRANNDRSTTTLSTGKVTSTTVTFYAILALVQKFCFDILLLENVDSLSDEVSEKGAQTNLEAVL
eukprot:2361743-Pyramimonas_sp.AAC.1